MCFRCPGTPGDGRGIVLDGRFGESPSSSLSSDFVVSVVQATARADRAMNLLTTAAAMVNTFAQGRKPPSVCLLLTDDYGALFDL